MSVPLPVILFEVLGALPSHFKANVGSYLETRHGLIQNPYGPGFGSLLISSPKPSIPNRRLN